MAANIHSVLIALGDHLRSMPGVPAIAWEAMTFSPPNGVWLRPTLLPSQPRPILLGSGETRYQHTPIYLINVFSPMGKGAAPASLLADQISNWFADRSFTTGDGINITTEAVWRSPAQSDNLYYQIPLRVQINFIR